MPAIKAFRRMYFMNFLIKNGTFLDTETGTWIHSNLAIIGGKIAETPLPHKSKTIVSSMPKIVSLRQVSLIITPTTTKAAVKMV